MAADRVRTVRGTIRCRQHYRVMRDQFALAAILWMSYHSAIASHSHIAAPRPCRRVAAGRFHGVSGMYAWGGNGGDRVVRALKACRALLRRLGRRPGLRSAGK